MTTPKPARGRSPEQVDADAEAIRVLAAEGLSSTLIAARLGLTRNAVCGRANKAGIRFDGSALLTDAQKKQAEALASEGFSIQAIADRIGRHRSTVASYCKRANLAAANSQGVAEGRRRDPAPPPPAAAKRAAAPTLVVAPRPATPPTILLAPAIWSPPATGGVRMTALASSGCKWPLNDPRTDGSPDWLFCGARQAEGSSYCAHHHELGSTAARTREERAVAARRYAARKAA